MNLALIPLFYTENTLCNQFNKAIDILLNSKNTKLEKRNISEILFIFADKILNTKEKEPIKRRLKMKLNVFDEILEEGARQNAFNVAKKLLDKELTVKEVCEVTDLTTEEVLSLKNSK